MTVWEVVGGGDKGGILVRSGQATDSSQEATRLATGARVKQLALEGERLHYERVSGAGPSTGWVSIRITGKDLLVKVDGGEGAAPATCGAEFYSMSAVDIDGAPMSFDGLKGRVVYAVNVASQ